MTDECTTPGHQNFFHLPAFIGSPIQLHNVYIRYSEHIIKLCTAVADIKNSPGDLAVTTNNFAIVGNPVRNHMLKVMNRIPTFTISPEELSLSHL